MTIAATFTLRREAFALEIDLTLRAGEVTAIVGPNGAGKTSVLRALSGLERISAGEIRMGERLVDDADRVFVAARDRSTGYVFQNYVLFPHLTVRDNVAFGLRSHGVRRKQARAEAERLLAHVGIAPLADRKPATLSGGEAQRVALARALAGDPSLLLLDEPLSAADAETRNDLRVGLVQRLKGFEGCCVVVTHDPIDALLLADRVIVLEKGRVVQDDSPAEITAHPQTDYVAALLNLNLIRGSATQGALTTQSGRVIHIADQTLHGPAAVVIRPESIGVHREQPHGSPRNVWPAVVSWVQPWEDKIRLHVQGQPPMTATITAQALDELSLETGSEVWLSAKAADIRSYPLA